MSLFRRRGLVMIKRDQQEVIRGNNVAIASVACHGDWELLKEGDPTESSY